MVIDRHLVLKFLQYTGFVLYVSAMFLFTVDAQAGIIADIGDVGFKIALIKLWKGLGGLALLISSYYLLSKRPTFNSRALSNAMAFTLYCSTTTAALLLAGQFWPVIYEVVQMTAQLIKHIFA